jgi:hypothetical protein
MALIDRAFRPRGLRAEENYSMFGLRGEAAVPFGARESIARRRQRTRGCSKSRFASCLTGFGNIAMKKANGYARRNYGGFFLVKSDSDILDEHVSTSRLVCDRIASSWYQQLPAAGTY